MNKLLFILCLMSSQITADVTLHNRSGITIVIYSTNGNIPLATLSTGETKTLNTGGTLAIQAQEERLWKSPVFMENGQELYLYTQAQSRASNSSHKFVLSETPKK